MGKCGKNYVQVGVGKMKTKTNFVIFSNACSVLEIMFCNRNLTNLVYPILLSSKQQRISSKIERAFENMTTTKKF